MNGTGVKMQLEDVEIVNWDLTCSLKEQSFTGAQSQKSLA